MVSEMTLKMSLLAMHAYNIGSDTHITGLAGGLGGYRLEGDLTATNGFSAGYFADTQNHKYISVRGTNPAEGWADPTGGWMLGGGNGVTYSPQIVSAINYLKSVSLGLGHTDPADSSITMVGHSLGGGIAGYLASIYGQSAFIFDNMAFERGASYDHDKAAESSATAESVALLNLMYDGDVSNIRTVDTSGITRFATTSELLKYDRMFLAEDGETQYLDPSASLSLFFDSHSMALQVVLQWATLNQSGSAWRLGAQDFFNAYFSEDVADNMSGLAPITGQLNGSLSTTLQETIAYSAVIPDPQILNEPTIQPFGDTAIVAMFDDMSDLGTAIGSFAGGVLGSVKADLGKIGVEFAGNLAVKKVMATTDADATVGALQLAINGSSLSVDLSADKWTFATDELVTSYRSDLIQHAASASVGLANFMTGLIDYAGWIGSAETDPLENISSVSIQLSSTQGTVIEIPTNGLNVLFLKPGSGADGAGVGQDRIIVGSGQTEAIYGGESNDVLIAGGGDDVILGRFGTNFLYGNDGADHITSTGDYDYLDGGNDDDQLILQGQNAYARGGSGNDTIFVNGIGNQVSGGADDDTIYVGVSDAEVEGGAGNDTIVLESGNGRAVGDFRFDDMSLVPGNDTVFVAGGGSSTIDLGGGTDQLIFSGAPDGTTTTSRILLGNASDTVWIGADATNQRIGWYDGSDYSVRDADATDRLIWNGYELDGGTFTVLLERTHSEIDNGLASWVDDHGVIYDVGSSYLSILFPDGSTLGVDDYDTGDFGLSFDEYHESWDLDGVPRASTAALGNAQSGSEVFYNNIDMLAGRLAAFTTPGFEVAPTWPGAISQMQAQYVMSMSDDAIDSRRIGNSSSMENNPFDLGHFYQAMVADYGYLA